MPDKTPGKGQTYSNGNQMWRVPRLIELASVLPATEVPVHSFKEWGKNPWRGDYPFTLKDFALHMQRVNDADLDYPVIVSAEGWIMDGCHRLVKAKLLGLKTIMAVRFNVTPEPCVPDMDKACWDEMEAAELSQ